MWDISGCSGGTGSLSVTLGNGVNIWAASERMWLRSQHTAPGKMGQYCYSETFPAKTKLNWVSMGLLPLQTHCKFSTSLICFSLQCTGAQKHDCHMSATFSALVLGQQLFTGFQNSGVSQNPEKERRALRGSLSAVLCVGHAPANTLGRNND